MASHREEEMDMDASTNLKDIIVFLIMLVLAIVVALIFLIGVMFVLQIAADAINNGYAVLGPATLLIGAILVAGAIYMKKE
ncbi:MAG: hypothetical protein WC067_02135 [Candidatus Methanomethylophilaceae archaeon]